MKPPTMTLRDYLRMIFRHGDALFLPILFSILLIPPLLMLAPVKYRAAAIIKRTDTSTVSTEGTRTMARGTPSSTINTMREEILAWTNIERIMKALKLDKDIQTETQRQERRAEIAKSVTFRVLGKSSAEEYIEVAAITDSPKLACDLANALADNYVEISRSAKTADLQKSIKYFQEKADESLRNLQRTEREIDKYIEEEYAGLPDVRVRLLADRDKLNSDKKTHEMLLSTAEADLAEIDKQFDATAVVVKQETTSTDNPASIEVQNQLIAKKKLLDQLLVRLTPEHPDVQELKSEIKILEAQLAEMPNRVQGLERQVINPVHQDLLMQKLTAQRQIKSEQRALAVLTTQIADIESKLQLIVGQEKRYNDLVRQKQEYTEQYDSFRHSYINTQARLQAEAGQYLTQVDMVARAFEPTQPYRILWLQLIFVCMAGGVTVGICLMFLLEFGDHSIRGADDAIASLNLPVLCSLSTVGEDKIRKAERRRTMIWIIVGLAVSIGLILGVNALQEYNPALFGMIRSFF